MIEYLEPSSMKTFLPIRWKKAKNDIVVGMDRKKYIDFTSSIFVMNFGHSNKQVKKRIKKQVNKNLLHSYIYKNEAREEYVSRLIARIPYYCEKALLLSSGTEATEAATKLMLMNGKKYMKSKDIILSFDGAMHGRTMAADLMKGNGIYSHKNFVRLPFPNINSDFVQDLHRLNIDLDEVAGIMIETYQGWSAKFLPTEYVKSMVSYCKNNSIVVCFDEVQARFYRTGPMFGFYNYHVRPDLVCFGKAAGSGLPLAGVVGRARIMDLPKEGEMSSTHSANPLCCAAGCGVLDELCRKNYFDISMENEYIINDRLKIFSKQCEINTHGSVSGIILPHKRIADIVCKWCMERGLLLVHTGRESIKLGPPITITKKNLNKGLDILCEVLNHVLD